MNSKGIISLAFGDTYDEMAAHCFCYSRKYTDLPIHLLTNKKSRSKLWDRVNNVTFQYMDIKQNDNRNVKTLIYKYSPFIKTLYIDGDVIAQHKGLTEYIDKIPEDGILVNLDERFERRDQVYSIYKEAYIKAGLDVPINIYHGGCVGFGKGDGVANFFKIWNENWIINGRGRDMPSLSCAGKISKSKDIKMKIIFNKELFSCWSISPTSILQHEYLGHVAGIVGYKDFKSYKPFDSGKNNMWIKDWR